MRCENEDEKKELKDKIAKINTFIYSKDKPFKAADVIKDMENYKKRKEDKK